MRLLEIAMTDSGCRFGKVVITEIFDSEPKRIPAENHCTIETDTTPKKTSMIAAPVVMVAKHFKETA